MMKTPRITFTPSAKTVRQPGLANFLRALVFVFPILCAGAGCAEIAGCTPKREAAMTDIVKKKSDCILGNLNRTPEQMLLDCAIPKDAEDIQNIIDLFTGAQVGAINAGAQLPNAPAAAGLAMARKDAGAH